MISPGSKMEFDPDFKGPIQKRYCFVLLNQHSLLYLNSNFNALVSEDAPT